MPLVERGEAPVGILAVPALEQRWVIPVDRAAFEHLAARVGSASAAFFGALAAGEESAPGPAVRHVPRTSPGSRSTRPRRTWWWR
ncbi:protein of unknown function [Streptomyces murinus]